MNFIVHAPLSEPPSEALPFRYVLCCAKLDCDMEVLLECDWPTRDLYWKFMKSRGMFDFISDIINPMEERGLRLDTKVRNKQMTVVAKYIRIENQIPLIESIRDKIIQD